MSSVIESLKKAFAGESQANRKYLAFAKKAEQENFKQVAKLFRAAADAETIHALNHLNVLGEVKGTAENLKQAVDGETAEFTKMYPAMISQAEQEGNTEARRSFTFANEVEKIHADLYQKASQAISSDSDLEEKDIYVCQVCGNTVEGQPPETCPICGVPRDKFKKID